MDNTGGILPPLPASDRESLDRNKYDGFYKVKARDFWGENVINTFEIEEPKKCDHEFVAKPAGAECTKCHFGLLGMFEIRAGKLFFKGDPIQI